MKLYIPEYHKDGFAALVGYSEESLRSLREALESAQATGSVGHLARRIADQINADHEELTDLLIAVASLRVVGESQGLDTETLIERLREALAEDDDERLAAAAKHWEATAEFLRYAQSDRGALSITSKATALRQEHEKTFCAARILTDVRYVFDSDGAEPLGALALHSLRLSFHETSPAVRETFLALDHDDLLDLKSHIEKALRKEAKLRALVTQSGIPFLEGGSS